VSAGQIGVGSGLVALVRPVSVLNVLEDRLIDWIPLEHVLESCLHSATERHVLCAGVTILGALIPATGGCTGFAIST